MDSKQKYLNKIRQLNITSPEGDAHLKLYRNADAETQNALQAVMSDSHKTDLTKFRQAEPMEYYKLPLQEQDLVKQILEFNRKMDRANRKTRKEAAEREKNKKWWE